MTTVDTRPRMTVAEIALMRRVVQWRKANGVELVGYTTSYVSADHSILVTWGPQAEIAISTDRRKPLEWHNVHTFTQGIDLLVALGYLPARFSSAYRAGYCAGMTDAARTAQASGR